MSATTIKVEGNLLKDIKKCLATSQSVTAFVRETLEKEVRQRQMIAGAEAYNKFLQENPEEQEWLEDWEEADLLNPPETKKSLYKLNSTHNSKFRVHKARKVRRPKKWNAVACIGLI